MQKLRTFMLCFDSTPWLNVGLRTLVAAFGGYGLALLAGATLATAFRFLPSADAAALAIMLAFSLHALVIIRAFATATVFRAVVEMGVAAAAFGVWLLLLSLGGGS